MPNTRRYGMRYNAIRYWQTQAKELLVYRGLYRNVSTFDARNIEIASSNEIGHAIIGLAYILTADKLKDLLQNG